MELLLKYAAEFESAHAKPAVSEMHPAMQFTRLGAVLRKHAVGSGELGLLARAAVTNSGHPEAAYDATPLMALRDWTQEHPEHELATKFNWERLPEKVLLDNHLREAFTHHNAFAQPEDGVPFVFPHHYARPSGSEPQEMLARRLVSGVIPQHGWATLHDAVQSAYRLHRQDDHTSGMGFWATPGNRVARADAIHDDLAHDRWGSQLPFYDKHSPESY